MMVQQKPFKLHVKPLSSVSINKVLLLSVFAVVIVLIALVIFHVFQSPKLNKTKKMSLTMSNAQEKAIINPSLKNLPTNYQDIKLIKKFLEPAQPKIRMMVPPAVQHELSILQQQQLRLQNRLSELKNKQHQQSFFSSSNVRDREAKESGLFFPQTSPPRRLKQPINSMKAQLSASIMDRSLSSKGGSSYEKQNMQSQKIQFLKSKDKLQQIYNLHKLEKPISPYEVLAGTVIPAVLISSVNTSLPGEVIAQVRQDIYDTVTGNFLLIPKGSKIIGQYDSRVSYGQRRVLIAFTRIIRPDGSSILLSKAPGTDLKGQSGMEGTVNNHWWRVLGAATLSTILSVGTGVASDNSGNNNIYYRSAEQNAMLSAAGNISQIGQNLTNRAINIQPTLTIPSGFEFNVIVQKDMVLASYH